MKPSVQKVPTLVLVKEEIEGTHFFPEHSFSTYLALYLLVNYFSLLIPKSKVKKQTDNAKLKNPGFEYSSERGHKFKNKRRGNSFDTDMKVDRGKG